MIHLNREAQFCDPDGGLPAPRPRWGCFWMLTAAARAISAHRAHWGAFPHTMYVRQAEYDRLVWEWSAWTDGLPSVPFRIGEILVLVEDESA